MTCWFCDYNSDEVCPECGVPMMVDEKRITGCEDRRDCWRLKSQRDKVLDKTESIEVLEKLLKEQKALTEKQKKRADELKRERDNYIEDMDENYDLYTSLMEAVKEQGIGIYGEDVINERAEKAEAERDVEHNLADRLRVSEVKLVGEVKEKNKLLDLCTERNQTLEKREGVDVKERMRTEEKFIALSNWLKKTYSTDVEEIMKCIYSDYNPLDVLFMTVREEEMFKRAETAEARVKELKDKLKVQIKSAELVPRYLEMEAKLKDCWEINKGLNIENCHLEKIRQEHIAKLEKVREWIEEHGKLYRDDMDKVMGDDLKALPQDTSSKDKLKLEKTETHLLKPMAKQLAKEQQKLEKVRADTKLANKLFKELLLKRATGEMLPSGATLWCIRLNEKHYDVLQRLIKKVELIGKTEL